jgi:hypothetical protein
MKTISDNRYTVIDTYTGQAILASAPRDMVEEALRITPRTIYEYTHSEKLVGKRYKITVELAEPKKDNNLPPKLLEQWRYLHERYKTV